MSEYIEVVIDGVSISVEEGTMIREAAEMLGINIPTLCSHSDLRSIGICRICVVEVEGQERLEASCCYPITRSMSIKTHSPKVRRARRHIVELLLAKHYGECYACRRNSNCELQDLAAEYGVDDFPFGHVKEPFAQTDVYGVSIQRDMNKCILCRRCVRTCQDIQGVGAFAVMNRGSLSEIAAFDNKSLADVVCINCGQCINRCPTAALKTIDSTKAIWDAIDDPEKHVVIQTAPSPRAGIGEEFGLIPGIPLTYQMNTALRMIGFDRVFDTNFAADLTIIEEATELIRRIYAAVVMKDDAGGLPQFTSCSPGWIKYIEHLYPDFLNHVSSCKSPQQMFGALTKTYYAHKFGLDPSKIVTVALMPCTAKKFECNRPEMCDSGYKDVDYGVTTREMAKMFKTSGISLPDIEKSGFDDPFGSDTGSGVIFAVTGGVMESALRTVLEFVLGIDIENLYEHARIVPLRGFDGVKYAEIKIPDDVSSVVPDILKGVVPDWEWLKGVTLKVGVAHGTANAKKIMEDIKAGGKFSECHFIEIMACPGGCLGGGGQPIPTDSSIRKERAKAIYAVDEMLEIRKSYLNPAVIELYEQFLVDGPGGKRAHRFLHTQYTPRGSYMC